MMMGKGVAGGATASVQTIENFAQDLQRMREVDFRRVAPASVLTTLELGDLQQKFRQLDAAFKQENALRLAYIAEHFPDSPLFCPVTLYGPINFGWREVATTRALAWVLDPENRPAHGFGDRLLRSFLLHLQLIDEGDELVGWRARSEHVKDGCRPDVFLEGHVRRRSVADSSLETKCVVIEAKLGAPSDAAQLSRYRKKWGEADLFLLSTQGKLPDSAPERCRPLNYVEVATALMKTMHVQAGSEQDLRGKPGFGFLRLFVAGLLQDVSGWTLRANGGSPGGVDPVQLKYVLENV